MGANYNDLTGLTQQGPEPGNGSSRSPLINKKPGRSTGLPGDSRGVLSRSSAFAVRRRLLERLCFLGIASYSQRFANTGVHLSSTSGFSMRNSLVFSFP